MIPSSSLQLIPLMVYLIEVATLDLHVCLIRCFYVLLTIILRILLLGCLCL